MKNRKRSDPLPRELLPGSSIEGDPAVWEKRVQNLMAAASPVLASYRKRPLPWWSLLANRLWPRLVVAAAGAAAIAIAVHFSLPAPSAPNSSLPALLADGDAATALLPFAVAEADPVLALVILEGNTP